MSDEIKNNVEETVIKEDTTPEQEGGKEDQKLYTQDEINEIIKNRLAREKKKQDDAVKRASDEAEKKRLAEQEQYKELAEKLQQEILNMNTKALNNKKESLLAKAGYKDEQINKYLKYIEGTTDEELAQSVEDLKKDIPPVSVGVDPSMKNPATHIPLQKDGYEAAQELMKKIFKK